MKNIIKELRKWLTLGLLYKILGFIIFAILFVIAMIYESGLIMRCLPKYDNSVSPFYLGLYDPVGKLLSIFLIVVLGFLILMCLFRVNKKNHSVKTDYRKVHYMDQATHGSAEWMNKKTIKDVFEVCNIADMNDVVYGQLTENGEKAVGYKKPRGAELNRNTLVLATSGSGKSFSVVKPFFLQHLKHGDSVCVSDPGGGLYGDLSQYCRDKGVNTVVINLAEPAYSMTWDMVKECINPDTERIDPLRIAQFSETFMSNTGNGDKDFFYDSACNLMRTVIAYTSYFNEKAKIRGYKRLYMKIKGYINEPTEDIFFQRINNGMVSFKWVRNYILKTAIENKYKAEEIEEIFDYIHQNADLQSPFTFDEVFNNMMYYSDKEKGAGKKLEDDYNNSGDEMDTPIQFDRFHPVFNSFLIFKSNDSDNVRKSAIQGAQLRFSVFSDPTIRHIVSTPGLDMNTFNLKQTALFVITSDKSVATKPISSLLFTFLFKDVQDVYDREEQKSKGTEHGNPCLGTGILLDDFPALGRINEIEICLADARKRLVYTTLIIQTISQIKAIYGPDWAESIQGNCATILFLGGNDPSTVKFISDFAGEATVLNESHNENSRFAMTGSMQPGYRANTTKRDIITRGEARTMKNTVLLLRQGEEPLRLNPMPWTLIPAYKECKPTNIYKQIKPYDIFEPLPTMVLNEKEGPIPISVGINRMYNQLINELVPEGVDKGTGEVIEQSKNVKISPDAAEEITEEAEKKKKNKKKKAAKPSKSKELVVQEHRSEFDEFRTPEPQRRTVPDEEDTKITHPDEGRIEFSQL